MTTETTERDLVTEVESLLNDVGFRGDFETVSRPLLRRLVEEVKTLRAKLNDPCLVAGCHVCGGKHDLSDLSKGSHD